MLCKLKYALGPVFTVYGEKGKRRTFALLAFTNLKDLIEKLNHAKKLPFSFWSVECS